MKYNCEILDFSKKLESPSSHRPTQDSPTDRNLLADFNGRKFLAQGNEILSLNPGGLPQWKNPLKIQGRPNELYVSGDRLLLTTDSNDYHAWGILGPALLIDMSDGSVITELKGRTGAALKNGRFILGLEGYGLFKTWLIDRNGTAIQEWNSYGHYVVDENDDIRVLEKDRNTPTNSRLVRLKLNGAIEKGPPLIDSQISKPVMIEDKSLLFIDAGVLRIADVALKEQYNHCLIAVSQHDAWRFHSKLGANGKLVNVDIYERSKEPPIEYTKHSWLLAIEYEH